MLAEYPHHNQGSHASSPMRGIIGSMSLDGIRPMQVMPIGLLAQMVGPFHIFRSNPDARILLTPLPREKTFASFMHEVEEASRGAMTPLYEDSMQPVGCLLLPRLEDNFVNFVKAVGKETDGPEGARRILQWAATKANLTFVRGAGFTFEIDDVVAAHLTPDGQLVVSDMLTDLPGFDGQWQQSSDPNDAGNIYEFRKQTLKPPYFFEVIIGSVLDHTTQSQRKVPLIAGMRLGHLNGPELMNHVAAALDHPTHPNKADDILSTINPYVRLGDGNESP